MWKQKDFEISFLKEKIARLEAEKQLSDSLSMNEKLVKLLEKANGNTKDTGIVQET